ncbi:MAG: rod-binding protein [Alphaproteobacteria bacterium]
MTGPVSIAPSLLAGAPPAPEGKTREQISKTAKQFESSFISIMLAQMFEGTGESDFSGGQGGQAFQSFLMDAFSKKVSDAGGIGLSSAVQREMLKMQGLE